MNTTAKYMVNVRIQIVDLPKVILSSKAEAKRQQQQKLAAIAGIEQASTSDFDAVLQDALAQAGIDR